MAKKSRRQKLPTEKDLEKLSAPKPGESGTRPDLIPTATRRPTVIPTAAKRPTVIPSAAERSREISPPKTRPDPHTTSMAAYRFRSPEMSPVPEMLTTPMEAPKAPWTKKASRSSSESHPRAS